MKTPIMSELRDCNSVRTYVYTDIVYVEAYTQYIDGYVGKH